MTVTIISILYLISLSILLYTIRRMRKQFKNTIDELTEERDSLQNALKRMDEMSKNLNREKIELERENATCKAYRPEKMDVETYKDVMILITNDLAKKINGTISRVEFSHHRDKNIYHWDRYNVELEIESHF